MFLKKLVVRSHVSKETVKELLKFLKNLLYIKKDERKMNSVIKNIYIILITTIQYLLSLIVTPIWICREILKKIDDFIEVYIKKLEHYINNIKEKL